MCTGQQRGTSRWSLELVTLLLALASVLSCRNDKPQVVYDRISKRLLHGDLIQAQDEAHRECKRLSANSEWAWRFRTLEARAMLQQGRSDMALSLIESSPLPSNKPDLIISLLTIEGRAYADTHRFAEADAALGKAQILCKTSASEWCGYVLLTRGVLASEQPKSESAEELYQHSLAFAREHGYPYLESGSLLDLGNLSLAKGHFDEAIDRSEDAYKIAKAIGARRLEPVAEGNIGWANYKLGNTEKALYWLTDAEKLASELNDSDDQSAWLTDAGYIYLDRGEFVVAEQNFSCALAIEQIPGLNSRRNIYNALRALSRLTLQTGDLASAGQYAQKALDIARHDGNRPDELYPMLVQGQIAARRGDRAEAERGFAEVGLRIGQICRDRHKTCSVASLKWETEHSLAQLYEQEKRVDLADREYRTALATFEGARDEVRHEDSQISFLTNAAHIYDDYVHFLVAEGKTDDALRWADFSRARTLAEGLGYLPKGGSVGPPKLDTRQTARRAGGTVLFYWLGEKQSYLWAITSQRISLFTLPPGKQIDDAVRRYDEALQVQDVVASADRDGQQLYQTLIGPAEALLKNDAKVFVVPDGSLNNLNFETLLVSDPNLREANAHKPKLHYWIEDVTIANASSLRVLGTARENREGTDRTLMIVGNSVAPNDEYRELPLAAAQMKSVESHFPEAGQKILTREQATPAAYLAASPEKFSYIHFVAHGIASRLSPLDSAIVLSKDSSGSDSFKLYARDIVEYSKNHPLRADLVTVSACDSAGKRAYSGEGLVGLSWAFMRAGARNVVAALWDVSDDSTVQLMDKFYSELNQGAIPDVALRSAKLSLLRGRQFRSPYYWAPFQLYARLG